MAINWYTVLKMVPWDEVISNAPKVADKAKRLWNSVAKKPQAQDAPVTAEQPALSPEAQAIAKLEIQLAAAEESVSELRDQMVASAMLINELADQNAQLVKHAEAQRHQIRRLAVSAIVLFILVATSLGLTLAG